MDNVGGFSALARCAKDGSNYSKNFCQAVLAQCCTEELLDEEDVEPTGARAAFFVLIA